MLLSKGDGRKWGQSPVDIDESSAVWVKFPALIMSGHWSQDGDAKMRNIGSTGDYRKRLYRLTIYRLSILFYFTELRL